MSHRVPLSAELIETLKHKVIQHNTAHPEAPQTRLEELKGVYTANHRGRSARDRGMQAVDRHLADLRLRQGAPLPPLGDCERLADAYLGRQEYGEKLHFILRTVRRMATEAANHAEGKRRRDLFEAALKHAKGLATALHQLDRRSIAELMGPTSIPMPSPPPDPSVDELADDPVWAEIGQALKEEAAREASGNHLSLLPLRLSELEAFVAQLERVAGALARLSETTPIPMGRPKLGDPLLFGAEALANLWLRASGRTPRQSFKQHSFGDFVFRVLGPEGLGHPATAIETAVRQVLEKFAPPEATATSADV